VVGGVNVTVCLVRHGRTTFGRDDLLCGWSDPPLDEVGVAHARELAKTLAARNFERVWTSDLLRAQQTAVLISGAEPHVDARLREIDLGDLDGKRFDSCDAGTQAALIAFDGFQAPGGESVDSFRERVLGFVSDLPSGDHLVVTHGGVIRLLLRMFGRDRRVGPCEFVDLAIPATSHRLQR
jgi:2,3-bisphosphoglycerate-dependent phosphoglycerate mutase